MTGFIAESNRFTFWTNLCFLVPACIALLESQWIHFFQLVMMTTASMFMHYKFGETVWDMNSMDRFLWDNFSALLSMYFAVAYVVSSGYIEPIATLACVHLLVFICSMMVAKGHWNGMLNNIGIIGSVLIGAVQLDDELYEFQWVQVVSVVCIAFGVLNLWYFDEWWAHGVWHIMAATCFSFAYLNKCDSDEWLIDVGADDWW